MTKNLIIANRLREVYLNGYWIANTNYKAQIETLSWKHATQKVGNLNTIADLIFHINYYLDGLISVLDGGILDISDKYSFDAPTLLSQEDWDFRIAEFLNNAENFAAKVENLTDDMFDKPFVKEQYGTYLRNIEGIIEHSYYPLGQIVVIKKLINEPK